MLEPSPSQIGVKCSWQWTSDLYLPKIFPIFGHILLKKALDAYPIELCSSEELTSTKEVEITFIIGHRGLERLPLLLKTLNSISGQKNCNIECIVIEQDTSPLIKKELPKWVKYIFTPIQSTESGSLAYSRSWAFNEGARHATANCLIFHDSDILVPSTYAEEVFKLHQNGYEFINLKRFIFYLSQASSQSYLNQVTDKVMYEFDAIVQNLEGGGSFGASKKTYFEIGGFDERFIGWGGEDNEFWERAETRKLWSYAYLPFIHLWHQAQPEKSEYKGSNTKKLYTKLQKLSPKKRISRLNKLQNF